MQAFLKNDVSLVSNNQITGIPQNRIVVQQRVPPKLLIEIAMGATIGLKERKREPDGGGWRHRGLLTGLGLMAIPGVGPGVADGFVSTAAGAVAGGAAGGRHYRCTDSPELARKTRARMPKAFAVVERLLLRAFQMRTRRDTRRFLIALR
jgi:hypothetical protein